MSCPSFTCIKCIYVKIISFIPELGHTYIWTLPFLSAEIPRAKSEKIRGLKSEHFGQLDISEFRAFPLLWIMIIFQTQAIEVNIPVDFQHLGKMNYQNVPVRNQLMGVRGGGGDCVGTAGCSKNSCATNSGSPEVSWGSVHGAYCSNIELGDLTWGLLYVSLLCVCIEGSGL